MKIHVCEIFSSLQGEGPSIGTPAVFLRLMGCNLRCEWCDTKYTWGEGGTWREVEQLATSLRVELAHRRNPLLVVTGGEPLLQQDALVELQQNLLGGFRWEIETNGTISPDKSLVGHLIVSPKMASSDVEVRVRLNYGALQSLERRGAFFKFACASLDDLTEMKGYVEAIWDGEPQLHRVGVQPVGITVVDTLAVMRELSEECMRLGFRLIPRLQILLWGNERGR